MQPAETETGARARFVITGGAGFIGRYLAERLAGTQSGNILLLDNLHRPCGEEMGTSSRIRLQRLDVRQSAGLAEAMRGCEVAFHLAAESTVMGAAGNPTYAFESNVAGTFNVLMAAKAAGVRRVVFTSSREVYGEVSRLPVSECADLRPVNGYGVSKAAAELYCQGAAKEGLETVILRLANVYGPRDHGRVIPLFAEAALAGRPLKVFDPEKLLDFVWIDSVVDALAAAGMGLWIRQPINIGSGKGLRLVEVAERIIRLSGSTSTILRLGGRAAEVGRFVADVSLSRELLGIPIPDDPLSHLAEVISYKKMHCRDAGTLACPT
jgi:nucleoside-diphosphate-sugar epimerase